MSPSTSTRPTTPPLTPARLGLRPIINCWGTYTIISGSRLVPQAAQAMVEASNHYVQMEELMERVGQRLAELTGAEWGYITCGCAAALTQLTAACIAGADPEKMARLPDTHGLRHEVICQKAQRNGYDHAILAAGGRIVEVVTEADLRAAMGERTAMVCITEASLLPSVIPAAKMIQIGHEYGLPCVVDAAAQRPDVPNPYLAMGADAVAYSGGKCLRGPQASGLVLGRKDLLQAAYLNAAPHQGMGRGMKAGKEEIMGLLAAVEAWVLGRDHAAEWRMWEGYLDTIRAALASLPSVHFQMQQPGSSNVAPVLLISWDGEALHCTPAQVFQRLDQGEPRIRVLLSKEGIGIMPYMMEDGDAEIVAVCLRRILEAGCPAETVPADPEPTVDVSGSWEFRTRYTLGESRHVMTLGQAGRQIQGTCRSPFADAAVEGEVSGERLTLRTRLGQQTTWTTYIFAGSVHDGQMQGSVSLGAYGQADWTAQRLADREAM